MWPEVPRVRARGTHLPVLRLPSPGPQVTFPQGNSFPGGFAVLQANRTLGASASQSSRLIIITTIASIGLCAGHFMHIISCPSHDYPHFTDDDPRGSEKLGNLPWVTQQMHGELGLKFGLAKAVFRVSLGVGVVRG